MTYDQQDPILPANDGSAEAGPVDVGHHAPGIAVVSMRGEHDISTEPVLAAALGQAAAHSDVLVDLSECTFIDSTAISALVKAARTAHERDDRFVLVIPPEQRNVARVAEMIRLAEFVDVHVTRDAALASLEQWAEGTRS